LLKALRFAIERKMISCSALQDLCAPARSMTMRDDLSEEVKTWNLVALDIAREAEETSSAALFELGATGILTIEETGERIRIGAYFDERADTEMIARMVEAELARAGLRGALFAISISGIPDQDWMQKWKEGFEPTEIGSRLVIAPSWKMPGETEGRAVIQIDPGMAFGTGTHETTRMCLELIEKRWRGGRLLDVGTGTGILAIAAAMLAPASTVTAIDIDPQAVEVARENIEINRVESSIEILEGQPADYVGRAFDMVIANLTAETLIDLMDDLTGCLAQAGAMIMSGILTAYAPDVEREATRRGLVIAERREAGEWTALVAERDDACERDDIGESANISERDDICERGDS
jgi:ribosomal protein L11 methyltransferase